MVSDGNEVLLSQIPKMRNILVHRNRIASCTNRCDTALIIQILCELLPEMSGIGRKCNGITETKDNTKAALTFIPSQLIEHFHC